VHAYPLPVVGLRPWSNEEAQPDEDGCKDDYRDDLPFMLIDHTFFPLRENVVMSQKRADRTECNTANMKRGDTISMARQARITPLPTQTPPLESLLTIEDVQKTLKVGRDEVYRLIREEGLPVVPLGGKRRRVIPSSLAQWAKEREVSRSGA